MEAAIFMANGLEECEALLCLDLLRRAGIPLTTVAVHPQGEEGVAGQPEEMNKNQVFSAHHLLMDCDCSMEDYQLTAERLLLIPGGLPGVNNLKKDHKLKEILLSYQKKWEGKEGGYLAAICAGPTVLAHFGLLEGKTATVYPGFEREFSEETHYENLPVCQDGWLITGRALGSAIPFALSLVEKLRDKEKAEEVARQIVYS